MVRTQIQLTDEQARELKRLAAERGASMAELVRAGVDDLLDRAAREQDWQRALDAMGRYRGGEPKVSEEHDRFLDEAFAD